MMKLKSMGGWLLIFWFILFVAIMVAETIYLHHTGTVYVLDYNTSMSWIQSWGVYAYLLDVLFVYICYKLYRRYRGASAESSNSRSDP